MYQKVIIKIVNDTAATQNISQSIDRPLSREKKSKDKTEKDETPEREKAAKVTVIGDLFPKLSNESKRPVSYC